MVTDRPLTSARARMLKRLEDALDRRSRAAHLRFLQDEPDILEDEIDVVILAQNQQVKRNRYLTPREKYRRRKPRWNLYLHSTDYLNGIEFTFGSLALHSLDWLH